MRVDSPNDTAGFSEKDFYLGEFRGRTLGLALAGLEPGADGALAPVLAELAANRTRVLVLSTHASWLDRLVGEAVVEAEHPEWLGTLWRHLRAGGAAGLLAAGDLAALGRRLSLRLRLAKLVWVDSRGPLRRPDGERLSFVAMEKLDAHRQQEHEEGGLDAERRSLLREVGPMLEGGVPSISLCTPEALADELFTYAGSGTFFSRERYTAVRWLALDEFEAAQALIRRGVEEGFLMPRSEAQIEAVLSHAFGVFVEGRYLAGIGALLQYPESGAAEIASLYTLTRFLGEGVGAHLLRFALESTKELGLDRAFACTSSARVVQFFAARGFREAASEEIPPEKWATYPAERRATLRCMVKDCAPAR